MSRPSVRIGFLPDEPVFYSYLSARETLELSAAMHGLDVKATMERIAPVAAQLRLTADMDNFADDFSRGMKKKLGLLLAILHQPKLLILDEPTNGLDVESTHLFYDLILDLAGRGTTVLFSTHLMDHVARTLLACRHHQRRRGDRQRVAAGNSRRACRGEPGGRIPRIDPSTGAAMTSRAAASPSFWTTVWLLLGVARRRAFGRMARQRMLLRRRGGTASVGWSRLGFGFVIVMAALVNGVAAVDLMSTFSAGQRVQAAAEGTYVVGDWFIPAVNDLLNQAKQNPSRRAEINRALQRDIAVEAANQAKSYGGDEKAIAARLNAWLQGHDSLIAASRLSSLPLKGALPDMLGLFVLLFWCAMLVCQGDGPDLDTQRQRHPMWEWLFSHPAPPGAIFLAEMISPIAANPVYLTAPLFSGLLYGSAYGFLGGVAAALLVGAPTTIALACLGKAIEINVLLRFSPRSRGAALGLMGWFGYASTLLLLVAAASIEKIVTASAALIEPLAALPWPRCADSSGTAGGRVLLLPAGHGGVLAPRRHRNRRRRRVQPPERTQRSRGQLRPPRRGADRGGKSALSVRQGAALSQGDAVVPPRRQRHHASRPDPLVACCVSTVQLARPAVGGAGRVELSLRRGDPVRHLFPADPRPEVVGVGRSGALDRADLAARPREPVEGQGATYGL